MEKKIRIWKDAVARDVGMADGGGFGGVERGGRVSVKGGHIDSEGTCHGGSTMGLKNWEGGGDRKEETIQRSTGSEHNQRKPV